MVSTPLADSTESLAIAGARAGDGHAFSRLVAAYQSPIYNLCYRMLGNSHDAEEAAQEAFLRAYTRLSSYDPARPFKTWLFSIAHHYCIDRLRRRRLTWLSLDDEPELQPANWRAAGPSPEEQAMRREREANMQDALATLPPRTAAHSSCATGTICPTKRSPKPQPAPSARSRAGSTAPAAR